MLGHAVEGVAEHADFVAAPQRDRGAEVAGGEPLGASRERGERCREIAAQPAHPEQGGREAHHSAPAETPSVPAELAQSGGVERRSSTLPISSPPASMFRTTTIERPSTRVAGRGRLLREAGRAFVVADEAREEAALAGVDRGRFDALVVHEREEGRFDQRRGRPRRAASCC